MASRPSNIGIKAIELYFPSQVRFPLPPGPDTARAAPPSITTMLTQLLQCVDQSELEKFDGVSQGKYTIGLGQTKMSFCDDREGELSRSASTNDN